MLSLLSRCLEPLMKHSHTFLIYYFQPCYKLSIEQDCLLWGIQVVIPTCHQKVLLEELHVGHPGIVLMKELVRSYVWWPNVDSEIEQTVRNCQ